MISSFLKLVRLSVWLGILFPVWLKLAATPYEGRATAGFWLKAIITIAAMIIVMEVLACVMRKLRPPIESLSLEQARFLDQIPDRYIGPSIVSSAAVSLFLQLAMIRWQGTVWVVFAFYKNFGLLSCFAGLGLGYALANRERIPLLVVLPLLAFQILWSITVHNLVESWHLVLHLISPIREQLDIGLPRAEGVGNYLAVFFLLAVTILLTSLAFVPVGQLCGRLLDRTQQLRAYGLNLLGSILGVTLMIIISFFWAPPIVWFVPCFLVIACFQMFQWRSILTGLVASSVGLIALAWPLSPGWEKIYSPYQLLERGRGEHGLALIRAAGHYYQRVHDLSREAQAVFEDSKRLAYYYELPYHLRPTPQRVAVVGAGAGNDVAAGLRSGVTHIDAIEIDPAILSLGVSYHPEQPYDDPRVTRVIDDARTFLRSTGSTYDLIVYGLLDSHTLLSHASSVRLDSFVYTVEGLRDARSHLNENGVVSLSFSVISSEIGRKIYLMMEKAFDGHPPICIYASYDGSVIFAQSKNGDLALDPALLARTGFVDRTSVYADPALCADVSTDDWPFFYMPRRVYPTSYIYVIGLMVLISLLLFGSFFAERPRFSHAAYFFMGAGFMLVETKGITEFGLTFGNTWQIIGIVIAAILIMAFLANLMVQKLAIRKPLVPFILLLASLGVGLWAARGGGFSSASSGQIAALIVLTCPMFFSGIVFSTLLAETAELSSAMAMNLIGAMFGGLLEYNSMYFGFQFLYWVAMVLYAAALASRYLVDRAAAKA